jgi:hypothetical protein
MALEVLDDNEDIQPEVAESATETKPVIDIAGGRLIAQKQLELLQKQLASRTNMPFNPILMKMAAGFLAPTKTGGFGESLGYAASAGAEEAEKERARKVDNEKLQLEVLKQQQTLRNQDLGFQLINSRMNKTPPSGATGNAGATGAGPTELMSTQQKAELVAKNPNLLDTITIDDDLILALGAMGMKDLANIASSIQKSQTTRAGLRLKQEENELKGYDVQKVPNPFDPSDSEGISLPRNKIAEFNRIAATGNKEEMARFLASAGVPGFFGQAPTAGATTEETGGYKPPPTKSEREAEKLTREKRIENAVKNDEELRAGIFNNQRVSTTEIAPAAKTVYNYATNPESNKSFGYFSDKTFKSVLGDFIEQGLKIGPSFQITFPGFKAAVMKLDPKISQKDLNAMYAVAQSVSKLELAFSASLKGQGQVSDYERSIVEKLSPRMTDTPAVAALKSEIILARTVMDNEKARMFNAWSKSNPNGFVKDFEQTGDYQKLVGQYNKKLEQLQGKYGF